MTGTHTSGLPRRDALRVGVLGALGLGLGDFLRLAEGSELRPRADSAIFIHLQGGPAHLDTLDMKPEAPVEERGEFRPVQSKLPGLAVCEHLPKFARVADRFALLRGISHSTGDHPQANQYLFTGNRPSRAAEYPCLGSVMLKERPVDPTLPGFVAVPRTEMRPGHLGIAYSPLKTATVPQPGRPFEVRGLALAEGLSVEKVRRRDRLLDDLDTRFRRADVNSQLLEGLDRFGEKAHAMILSDRTREAFDTGRESPRITGLFAGDEFSQSLLLACRLVEHGVRFVTVDFGGWDTHLDNFQSLKSKLLPPLDAGLTALVETLTLKGLLERTLVFVSGEFGRTPAINKNAGRDHWPRAMWSLMTGGGVRAGQLIGGTDAKGHLPDDRTHITPDDLAASLLHALGVDHHKEYHTPAGRPVTLVPHGRVIPELFG